MADRVWADVLVGRLTSLGDARTSGCLHVPGRPGGQVYLVQGRVGAAETPAVPTAQALLLRGRIDRPDELTEVDPGDPADQIELVDRIDLWREQVHAGPEQAARAAHHQVDRLLTDGLVPQARLEAAVRAATVDAVTSLGLSARDATSGLTFEPQERHPFGEVRPVEVPDVVRDVAACTGVLRQIAAVVSRADALGRTTSLPGPRLRLSAAQWELVRTVDGVTEVATMAWLLGRTVITTVVEAYRLVRLGVLTVIDPDGSPRAPVSGADGRPASRPELSFLRSRTDPGP
jgi:hypothetical protein